MAAAQPAVSTMASVGRLASAAVRLRQATYGKKQIGVRLNDNWEKEVVDDIFANALKKQTGVSLKYM
jgi:pyruvate dehydrogenase kinase 2/3/4